MVQQKRFSILWLGSTDLPLFSALNDIAQVDSPQFPSRAVRCFMLHVYDAVLLYMPEQPDRAAFFASLFRKIYPPTQIYTLTDSGQSTEMEQLLPGKVIALDLTQRTSEVVSNLLQGVAQEAMRSAAAIPEDALRRQSQSLIELSEMILDRDEPEQVLEMLGHELSLVFPDYKTASFERQLDWDTLPFPFAGDFGNFVRACFRVMVGDDYDFLDDVNRGLEQLELLLPVVTEGSVVGFCAVCAKDCTIGPKAETMFRNAARHLFSTLVAYNRNRQKLIHDQLSGLYNHSYLYYALRREWERNQHLPETMGFVIVDVDNFKSVNDSHGHRTGDSLIVGLGQLLLKCRRRQDILARYGGDEFAVIMPNATKVEVSELANGVLESVRDFTFTGSGQRIHVTVSIGYACTEELQVNNEIELLDLADRAMYVAKRNGRDQVRSAVALKDVKTPELSVSVPSPATVASEQAHAGSRGHILIVDDDAKLLLYLETLLKHCKFSVVAASTPTQALDIVRARPDSIDAVVSDVEMPEMDGIELANSVRNIDPNLITILITGHASTENTIEALRAGVFNFVQKPFTKDEIEIVVERAVERRRLRRQVDTYHSQIEEMLQERTAELHQALTDLRRSYVKTMELIVTVQDTHESMTAEHSQRVSRMAVYLAKQMGIIDLDLLEVIKYGALLHDIGKIGIPDAILTKPAKLTDDEMDIMRRHVEMGQRIVRTIPSMEQAAEMVLSHHERWDGKGYPRRLKGEDIFVGARIFMVIDTFDALFFDRHYSKGKPLEEVVAEINACSGTQFDPQVVEAFNGCYEELCQLSLEPVPDWEAF